MQQDTSTGNSETAKFLTIYEAALRIGVSPDTIRRRVKSGELPAALFAGKYRIAVDDLDAMVRRAA